MLKKTSMLFINHPHKYQCAHTTTHRGQGECVTVMRCEISDRTVSSSILQCEDWRPNSTKFYRLWLTSTPHIHTHICTHFSKHCQHIYIYECIMWNLLLFGILVWKYAECKPGNDTTTPPILILHILLPNAPAASDGPSTTTFQGVRTPSVFQHFSLPHRLCTTLTIDSSSSERNLSHYGVTFPFSSLKSDPSTSHCYDRN